MAAKPPDTPFGQYIARLIKKYGTAGRVAAMIPMSLSAFSRGVNEESTLSFGNCLRLARAMGENPGSLLRLAGKPHDADLMDHFTEETTETLSSRGRCVAQEWETLDTKLQDAVELLVQNVKKLKPQARGPRSDVGGNNPNASATVHQLDVHRLETYRLGKGLSYGVLSNEIFSVTGRRFSWDCIRKICQGKTKPQRLTAWAIDKFMATKVGHE